MVVPTKTSDVTNEELEQFRRLVVPYGATRYHGLRRGSWVAEKWEDARWKRLDPWALRAHLSATGYLVAPRWDLTGNVRHAVIDLDSPLKHVSSAMRRLEPELVADADEEMQLRLLRVLRALGTPPHVVFRSSTTRGLHVYLFFDRLYPAADVNRVLDMRLSEAGLPPHGDVVDKIFPSNQALRLPLGPGSCILEHDSTWRSDLRVVAADEVPLRPLPTTLQRYTNDGWGEPPPGAFILRRRVSESIATLAELVSQRRIPLSLIGTPPGGVQGRKVRVRGASVPPGTGALPEPAPTAHPGKASDAIGPAERGRRHDQTRALVRRLRLDGYDLESAMSEVRRWLRVSARHGTSKDLRGATRQTIERYVDDARGAWEWFDRNPQALVRKPPRFVPLALIAGLGTTTDTSSTSTPPAWSRKAAVGALTEKDIITLGRVPCDWYRKKLAVLVGLLRQAEKHHGQVLTYVTISAAVLDRVLGGRRPPPTAMTVSPFSGSVLGPRPTLLREARRLGILSRQDHGIEGVRASLFRVTLP